MERRGIEYDPESQTEAPIVSIQPEIIDMDVQGTTKVKFPFKVKVPEEYENIKNRDVIFRQASVQRGAKEETLRTESGFKDFVVRPAIDVNVQQTVEDPDANLGLDWEILEFTEDYVTIKVDFEDPENFSLDEQ